MCPPAPDSLPTSTSFLTDLLSSLPLCSSPQQDLTSAPDSPLVSSTTKPTLLTLHAIFPTILLPALDLLDRRLVTKFTLQDVSHGDQDEKRRVVYYVRSNAQHDGRSRYGRGGDVGITSYEVRTVAWSCSCAAFAFSAFNNSRSSSEYETRDTYEAYKDDDELLDEDAEMLDVPGRKGGVGEGNEWLWGGLVIGEEEAPLCKHLLACVLAERWEVAAEMIDEREVGREEMAGWAAGWGG